MIAGAKPSDMGSTVKLRTVSPPMIDNRSLFVDPRKHAYRSRAEHAFPPLVSR